MFPVILFDLDGTLTDSQEGIFNCIRYAFEKMGKQPPSIERLTPFIGPPLGESFVEFCGFSQEEAEIAVTFFRERYRTIGKFENRAAPGMPGLCRRLKEKGFRLALASSKPEPFCVEICEKFGYAESLETIAGSSMERNETKADVIAKALDRLGLLGADKSRILMLGDRKHDVEGAKQWGIACVGVDFFGYAPPFEMKDAGAEAVFSSAQELETYLLDWAT
jgi:phosphoglycolate phosphatase